ncbi:MAG TPA: zinc ribbon domain-containing protein [Gemmataceae bacterium]|nr:zinc ribbon domain-containing protein [Gemmataceae bacterium]
MRCPACQAENPRDAVNCTACNAALPRRPPRRRVIEDGEAAGSPNVPSNRPALRAYRLSLIGLIPIAGLVCGPVAVILGALAARKVRGEPTFTAQGPLLASVVIGAIDAVTNWVGVTLMAIGLWPYLPH